MSKNIAKWFRGLDIDFREFKREEKICIDIWQTYKANLPIDGIHLPPLIPERKRTLFQMLRIERHFEKKLNKLAAAKDEAEKEQPKSRASSSLNTMRFRQL